MTHIPTCIRVVLDFMFGNKTSQNWVHHVIVFNKLLKIMWFQNEFFLIPNVKEVKIRYQNVAWVVYGMEVFYCYFHEEWLLQLFKIIISNINISTSKIALVGWSRKPCKPKKWIFVPQIKGSTRNYVVHPCFPSWNIFNFSMGH